MQVAFPVLAEQPAPHLSGWLATEQKLMFKTNFRSANALSMSQSLTWNMGLPQVEGSGLPARRSAGAVFQLQSLMYSEVHSVASLSIVSARVDIFRGWDRFRATHRYRP